jgi:hyperosmotically inducible periplasmic protein
MIGSLLRTVLVILLVVGALAFFAGYRLADGIPGRPATDPDPAPVGTIGREPDGADRQRARERGAAIGERVAVAGERATEALSDGAVTAKIKSKMALDDLVRARDIDVDTTDGNVTLSGRVHSEEERQRALALARETAGVRTVVDRLQLK